MTVAFTTGDLVNCPVMEYKLEYINEYVFNLKIQGTDQSIIEKAIIDSKTGVFTLKNCT